METDPSINKQKLNNQLTSLIGEPARPTNHSSVFKLRLRSKDDRIVTVNIPVNPADPEQYPSKRSEIAKRLHLSPAKLEEAFRSWSRQDLIKHLQQFDAKDLVEPRLRHLYE